jgi:hypothetical protein
MESQVERAIQRTKRYWYEDGLVEIAAGILFVVLGALFFAEATASPGAFLGGFSAIGLPIVLIGGGEVARRVVSSLKERVTYPRTGYVEYPRPGRRPSGLAFAVGAALAALIGALAVSQPITRGMIPALQGILIGAAWAWFGYTLGLRRFLAVACLSAVVGVAAAYVGLGDTLGSAAYFAALGAALAVSGGLTLSNYLARTQPAES